ncbi:MAG: hypothetical protein JSS49_03905 [Planctomycetes bacterium]|nr:hypothetical protein [Planctomycetota bacterium]
MTINETEFRDASFRAISTRSTAPSDATLGTCDVLVLVPSPQERGCKIAESGSSATEKVVMLGSVDTVSALDSNASECSDESRLSEFSRSAKHVENLSASGRADSSTLEALKRAIVELFGGLRRPLHVGIDLTCCPIYYCLGLMAFLFNNGIARRLSLFYAEGEYPEVNGHEECHELFTAGEWEAVAIPGLQNPWIPRRSRLYLVSVGFEGYKTLRLFERREPDRIVVLFPDPGVLPDYVDRTYKQNKLLLDRFSINEGSIIRANAADAVAAWKALTERNAENFIDNTVEYLCCGTKPHSLAIGLRSLCTKHGVVSDIVAEEQLSPNVKASGVYWRYDIVDLSAI